MNKPQKSSPKKPSWSYRPRRSTNNRRGFNIMLPLKRLYHRVPKKKMFKLGFGLGLILLLLGGIAGVGLLALFTRDLPDPNRVIDRSLAESTKIFDRSGETILYDIHGEEQRTSVNLNDLPSYVIDAAISAEDKDFYKHSGFDLSGIFRAVIKNLLRGGKVQGGSTITQQFVKNAILSNEKTYSRKIKELVLAYRIEKAFSKEDILQLYFNEIPYGSTAYGVEAAAQSYFAKSARDITLAEAAILASLPKAPTYYSPFGPNKDKLLARQARILDGMAKQGYISQDDADQAKNQELEFKRRSASITAPHFIFYVQDLLAEKFPDRNIEQDGLKVFTTLDLHKQEAAEKAVADWVDENEKSYGATNAALVAIDPKTGEIVAMVGSKDYYNDEIDGQVNVALRPRQPGSSFKPIVYVTAFENGYTPETVLMDVLTTFKTNVDKDYEPHNYDDEERGAVTIKKALAGSLNIPAVKMIYLVGIDKVLDLAEDLGYTTLDDRSRFGLSLVLGGGEVTLLEHVSAYGTLAREGEWRPPSAILRVEDKDGKTLYKWEKPKAKKVVDTQAVRQLNSILSDNSARAYAFGEQNYLNLGDRPVAAKTGTTNDFRDGWTLGFTPSLAAGVWVGNNDNSTMKGIAAGGNVAAPIWHSFMKAVLGDTPKELFKKPKETESDKFVLTGEVAEPETARVDIVSKKLATEFTPRHLIEEKQFALYHSILHYVDKDDPEGKEPSDPADDPEYEGWELALQQWAGENNLILDEPPVEFDDIHLPEKVPSITSLSLVGENTVTSRDLSATISYNAPNGPGRVEYFIDDTLIATAVNAPYGLNTRLPNFVGNGAHKLRAVFYDQAEYRIETFIPFILEAAEQDPLITWEIPSGNAEVRVGDFPLELKLKLANADTQKISIHAKSGVKLITIAEMNSPKQEIAVNWDPAPLPGDYTLFAEIINAGSPIQSAPLKIKVTE